MTNDKIAKAVAAETTIELQVPGDEEAIVVFEQGGKIKIRGEEVADNKAVYAAIYAYLTEGQPYLAGYAAAKAEYQEAVERTANVMAEAKQLYKEGFDRARTLECLCNTVAEKLANEVYTEHGGFVDLDTVVDKAVQLIQFLKRKVEASNG